LAISEDDLHHSKSFSDLQSHSDGKSPVQEKHRRTNGALRNTDKTSPKLARPKATLQRQDSSPLQRQQGAQDAIHRRIGDIFFSLHCADEDEPVYISEVIERSMNPDFRFFDLEACGSAVTRQGSLTIKIWAKATSSQEWVYLVELDLDLPSLQYIGKTLEGFRHPFSDNCVIFHLEDGIYISPTNVLVEQTGQPVRADRTPTHAEPTSSYDELVRLHTLSECIQDALDSREKLISEINALITEDKDRFSAQDAITSAEDSLATIKRSVITQRRNLKAARTTLASLKSSNSSRRASISNGYSTQKEEATQLATSRTQLSHHQTEHKTVTNAITGQRRRICEDLQSIFTIHPIPHRSLAFTIRSLHLPNSDFPSAAKDADTISAALGHVAHVLHLLSLYLRISLPYPLAPRASTSLIRDPISLMPHLNTATSKSSSSSSAEDRTFPLYVKGSVFYRFEYAVFLLNKDIEVVAGRLGLRVLDIRQTLPNLKYVLYVGSAGVGELPGRIRGGVRGLLRGEEDVNGTKQSEERAKKDTARVKAVETGLKVAASKEDMGDERKVTAASSLKGRLMIS